MTLHNNHPSGICGRSPQGFWLTNSHVQQKDYYFSTFPILIRHGYINTYRSSRAEFAICLRPPCGTRCRYHANARSLTAFLFFIKKNTKNMDAIFILIWTIVWHLESKKWMWVCDLISVLPFFLFLSFQWIWSKNLMQNRDRQWQECQRPQEGGRKIASLHPWQGWCYLFNKT